MSSPRRLTAAATAIALLGGLVACGSGGGGGGGTGPASRPAPSASLFPKASGRPLLQVLAAGKGNGPVVSPSATVFTRGVNRVSFGVFTTGQKAITDAQVALYAAHGPKGPTEGPFPARIESLTTEQRFRAKTTADDPMAAHVVYTAELPFDAAGEWRVGALIRDGGSFNASLMPSLIVGAQPKIPAVGQKAPLIHTPTAADVGGDLSKIDTRIPPDDMHSVDYADAYGKRPIVIVFATPQLCQSRVCGPVVDVAEQVKQTYGDRAAFIHMEVYNQNDATKGVRPQLRAFHLQTEPWLFAIDRHGIVRARFEGAFGVDTLEGAVKAAIGG
jgi:hypothetical protein